MSDVKLKMKNTFILIILVGFMLMLIGIVGLEITGIVWFAVPIIVGAVIIRVGIISKANELPEAEDV